MGFSVRTQKQLPDPSVSRRMISWPACDRLIARRTAVINQLRAFLLELGIVFAGVLFL